ncbi:hypothetical protein [Mycoplasmopsis pulmonis]|uniref:hypothetical protein n=1 Tax=Mycoplasmopsis pulmonis TaxID=2107 RepID=UPI00100517A3|nr:hypothetical protein [Mycoplasmopsis pulmonis]VEU68502.1 Uncharacterised protein [Mycoplasmopsis pulmonis]
MFSGIVLTLAVLVSCTGIDITNTKSKRQLSNQTNFSNENSKVANELKNNAKTLGNSNTTNKEALGLQKSTKTATRQEQSSGLQTQDAKNTKSKELAESQVGTSVNNEEKNFRILEAKNTKNTKDKPSAKSQNLDTSQDHLKNSQKSNISNIKNEQSKKLQTLNNKEEHSANLQTQNILESENTQQDLDKPNNSNKEEKELKNVLSFNKQEAVKDGSFEFYFKEIVSKLKESKINYDKKVDEITLDKTFADFSFEQYIEKIKDLFKMASTIKDTYQTNKIFLTNDEYIKKNNESNLKDKKWFSNNFENEIYKYFLEKLDALVEIQALHKQYLEKNEIIKTGEIVDKVAAFIKSRELKSKAKGLLFSKDQSAKITQLINHILSRYFPEAPENLELSKAKMGLINELKPEIYVEKEGVEIAYPTLQDAISNAQDGQKIFLNKNLKLDKSIVVDKNITIFAKSNVTITRKDSSKSFTMFIVQKGALTFEIAEPSSQSINLNGLGTSFKDESSLVKIEKNAKLVAKTGTAFINSKSFSKYGSVFENYGSVVIEGAKIWNNVSESGGIIRNHVGSSLTFKNGEIRDNISTGDKGIIYSQGNIAISGGSIDGNKSFRSSLINLEKANINFNSGSIVNNASVKSILFEIDNSKIQISNNALINPFGSSAIFLKNNSTMHLAGSLEKIKKEASEQRIEVLVDLPTQAKLISPKNIISLDNYQKLSSAIFKIFSVKNINDFKHVPLVWNTKEKFFKLWPDTKLFVNFYKTLKQNHDLILQSGDFESTEKIIKDELDFYFRPTAAVKKLILTQLVRTIPKYHKFWEAFEYPNFDLQKWYETINELIRLDFPYLFDIAYPEFVENGKMLPKPEYIHTNVVNPVLEHFRNEDVARIWAKIHEYLVDKPQYNKGYLIDNFRFKDQILGYLTETETINVIYLPENMDSSSRVQDKGIDLREVFQNPKNWSESNQRQNTYDKEGIFIKRGNEYKEYISLKTAIDEAKENETIIINENVEIESSLTINKKINFTTFKNVNITRKYPNHAYAILEVAKGGDLTLEILNPAKHSLGINGLGIDVKNSALVNVKQGGKLSAKKGVSFVNAYSSTSYFAVFLNSGKILIDGAKITDNYSKSASVLRNEGGEFEFLDGVIANNRAKSDVAIIYNHAGKLKLMGGKILYNQTEAKGLIWSNDDTWLNASLDANFSLDRSAIQMFNNAKLHLLKDVFFGPEFTKHIILSNNSTLEVDDELKKHFVKDSRLINVVIRDFAHEKFVLKVNHEKSVDLAGKIFDHFNFVDDQNSKAVILEAAHLESKFKIINKDSFTVLKNLMIFNAKEITKHVANKDEAALGAFMKKISTNFHSPFLVKQLLKHPPIEIFGADEFEVLDRKTKTLESFANSLWSMSEKSFIFAGTATAMSIGFGVAAFFVGPAFIPSAIGSAITATTLFIQGGVIRSQYYQLVNSKDWDKIKHITYSELANNGKAAITAVGATTAMFWKILAVVKAFQAVKLVLELGAAATSWSNPLISILVTAADLIITGVSFLNGVVF